MQLKKRKGQFSIIAAFLVIVILVSAIIQGYNRIQENPFTEPVTILSQTQTFNNAIKNILAFSTSYYCSIFNITGDYFYAQSATKEYLDGGLNKLAHSEKDVNPSFDVTDLIFKIKWYKKDSYSNGSITLSYDMPNLGLYDVKYSQNVSFKASTLKTIDGDLYIKVFKDGEIDLSLKRDSFQFIFYDQDTKTWKTILSDTEPIIRSDGVYIISIPPEINQNAYSLIVRDSRGLIVKTTYVDELGGTNPDFTAYKYTFNWNNSAYAPVWGELNKDWMILEYLQNGTLRYLGQSINRGHEKALPQIPVRQLRVNQTIDGISREVYFQIEDWSNEFRIPYGLTNNNTLVSEDNMIVFLVNHHVSDLTIWWTDEDNANQTTKSIYSGYFNDNMATDTLRSNVMTLDLSNWGKHASKYDVISTYNSVKTEAKFALTNGTKPLYPSHQTYVIVDGVVRDIVTKAGIVDTDDSSMPTIFYNIILTLPANATYYTFSITNTLSDTSNNRRIDEICPIHLTMSETDNRYIMENLVGNSLVIDSALRDYDSGNKNNQHRFAEYINTATPYKGSGLIIMSETNDNLYSFDNATLRGAIDISSDMLKFAPVHINPLLNYRQMSSITWDGAVISFESSSKADTLYYKDSTGDQHIYGLWPMVVFPPSVI